MFYRKRFLFIILFSFLFTFFANLSSAHSGNLPFLNKSKIRVSVAPGGSDYGEIIVENYSEEERRMKLYLEDWYYIPGGDGAKEFLPAGTLSRSCASWISFSPAEFTIPPFGKQRVSYSIKAPQDAESGGYYSALFFETIIGDMSRNEISEGQSGLNLAVRVASLFYVEVSGNIRRTAEFENLALKRDNPNSPLLIELELLNTGNVDITAGGTFHIMDDQGVIYARGEFNKVYTFPKDKAKLVAKWKEDIKPGSYYLVLTLDLGKAQEELGIGRGPVITKEIKVDITQGGSVKIDAFNS